MGLTLPLVCISHAFLILPSVCVCSLRAGCLRWCCLGSPSHPPRGRNWYFPQSCTLSPCVTRCAVILTLSFPPYRCLYPQPCVPRLGAKGLGAGWAQGGVPPLVCPAHRGGSERDSVLSAAPRAEACHARAPGHGAGLGADPAGAREGLGRHVRPVRYAQDREDCVIAGLSASCLPDLGLLACQRSTKQNP